MMMPLVLACALVAVCLGCSSDADPEDVDSGPSATDAGTLARDGSTDDPDGASPLDGGTSAADGATDVDGGCVDCPTPDVTSSVEIVGTPDYSDGSDGAFARNPWDMIAFGGRIYVGAGNSDNGGSPDGNAGPVKIVSFVPGETTFLTEGVSGRANLPEEQVDIFRTIGGTVWTCGHDPSLGWDVRTFYRLDAGGGWTQIRSTFTDDDYWGVHCYDLLEFGGAMFSAGYRMGRSVDDGLTWARVGGPMPRRHTLIVVGGRLFALGLIDDAVGGDFVEWNPATDSFAGRNIDGAQVFPGASWWGSGTVGKIVRPITVGAQTLYLGGRPASDHQSATLDVFVTDSWADGAIDVTRTTPEGERPWDLLARGSIAYLLTSAKSGTGADEVFRVTVWRSSPDLTGWDGLFTVSDLTTFARSFEEADGDFYLGLGTDDGRGMTSEYPDPSYTTEVEADSGLILRVPSGTF